MWAIEDADVMLEDCHKQQRRVRQRIVPRWVVRAGQLYECEPSSPWPNPASGRPSDLAGLVVRDADWREIMQKYQCC